jgi:hypothetical protein
MKRAECGPAIEPRKIKEAWRGSSEGGNFANDGFGIVVKAGAIFVENVMPIDPRARKVLDANEIEVVRAKYIKEIKVARDPEQEIEFGNEKVKLGDVEKWLTKSAASNSCWTKAAGIGAVVAAVSGVVAVAVGLFAWWYPKEPLPFKMNENFIYDNNFPIGHVSAFRIDPVLMGQFALRIDEARKLNIGEVIGFHDARCMVIVSEGETSTVVRGKDVFAYNHIDCRIIGR